MADKELRIAMVGGRGHHSVAPAFGRTAKLVAVAGDGLDDSAKTILTVPTNLKAASASYSSIKLTWSAVAGASGYAVYRATSLTGTYSLVTSSVTATSTTPSAR